MKTKSLTRFTFVTFLVAVTTMGALALVSDAALAVEDCPTMECISTGGHTVIGACFDEQLGEICLAYTWPQTYPYKNCRGACGPI